MKVGTHAGETLVDIIDRKREEIDAAGFALWGYGGNTCHPRTMVQPFARDYELRGDEIHLVMQPMESKHLIVSERAEHMSPDGIAWEPIPAPINVVGSQFALAIEDLQPVEFELSLSDTRVARGNCRGRRGDKYIKGRVDKAILEVVGDGLGESEPEEMGNVHIGLAARLVKPYSVFVRA